MTGLDSTRARIFEYPDFTELPQPRLPLHIHETLYLPYIWLEPISSKTHWLSLEPRRTDPFFSLRMLIYLYARALFYEIAELKDKTESTDGCGFVDTVFLRDWFKSFEELLRLLEEGIRSLLIEVDRKDEQWRCWRKGMMWNVLEKLERERCVLLRFKEALGRNCCAWLVEDMVRELDGKVAVMAAEAVKMDSSAGMVEALERLML